MASSRKGMWGERLRTFMMDYNHYAGIALNGECLPHPFNTVTVVPEERDQYGLPIPKVTFRWGANERKLIGAGVAQMRRILEVGGGSDLFEVDDTAHLLGACRMGSDPRTSVVDRWCRTWDISNLFICDGSVFVTSSGVNPSLTIEAIAARTAAYIRRAARRGEL
ncbi:MAG: GMC family oxidoreductase [Roseiflexaceae bacterium]